MNAWLGSLKLRVLIPLVWASLFAVVSLTGLIALATGLTPYIYWRGVIFGTCVVTMGAVTGIKTRRR